MIVDQVPPPTVDESGPFQMQISSLDYSTYEGVIGIGRITRGRVERNQHVMVIDREGLERKGKVMKIYRHSGLERVEAFEAFAGDIICLTGVDKINISDTLCAQDAVEALPPLSVDEPTLTMMFCVNNSPLSGREGKYLSLIHI